MPNAVQKFAHHIINQLKRVAPSTSPQSAPLSVDASLDGESKQDNLIPSRIDIENHHYNKSEPQSDGEITSVVSECSSHALERHPEVSDENDIVMDLEVVKSLRIDDALTESRKMQETLECKPKLVNTRHLMKELLQVKKASEESDGTFTIEPYRADEDDDVDLSEWEARFYKLDETSSLWKSMQEYQVDCVKFRISFPCDYPFSPPFVRLVSPYIDNGFVMNGGAICLEILTPQGWSSAYTMEALMVQVVASLAHGGAVVSKHHGKKQHKLTKKKAEAEFKRIVKIHNKYGWVKLERNEG